MTKVKAKLSGKNLTKGGASTYVEGFYNKRGVTIYEDSTKIVEGVYM